MSRFILLLFLRAGVFWIYLSTKEGNVMYDKLICSLRVESLRSQISILAAILIKIFAATTSF